MLLGELTLDASPAIGTMGKLEGSMGGVTGVLGGLGGALSSLASGPLGAITAAIGTVAGVLAGLKDAMGLGSELHDLSLRTGESAGSLTILREAFQEAGLGADGLGSFLMRMQKSLNGMNEDGEDASKVFSQLGVSIEELKGLDAIGQFQALQKGFQGITDQATKASLARDLFGKGGGKALSLLQDTQVFDDARKRAGPLADVMDKNAVSFDKMGDAIGSLKLDFQEFFAGALTGIAPEVTKIAESIDSIDFVGIGEAVGSLAGMILKLGEEFGKAAPAINWVSEKLSHIFGSGSKADAGLSSKYAGLSKLMPPGGGGGEGGGVVSSMQKIGRGGGFGGGSSDPLLSETQRQTAILTRIEQKIGGTPPASGHSTYPPV